MEDDINSLSDETVEHRILEFIESGYSTIDLIAEKWGFCLLEPDVTRIYQAVRNMVESGNLKPVNPEANNPFDWYFIEAGES